MSCITKLLELQGSREFLPVNDSVVIEGGGVYKGHEYLVVFTIGGHRCGYVALKSNEHAKIDEERDLKDNYFLPKNIDCHGGVTFYDNSHAAKELLPVQCDDFWVGFDAAHFHDALDPGLAVKYFNDDEEAQYKRRWQTEIGHYEDSKHRDFAYMESECHRIIDQLESWAVAI